MIYWLKKLGTQDDSFSWPTVDARVLAGIANQSTSLLPLCVPRPSDSVAPGKSVFWETLSQDQVCQEPGSRCFPPVKKGPHLETGMMTLLLYSVGVSSHRTWQDLRTPRNKLSLFMGMWQDCIAKKLMGFEKWWRQSLENIIRCAIFQTQQLYSYLSALCYPSLPQKWSSLNISYWFAHCSEVFASSRTSTLTIRQGAYPWPS